MDSTHFILHLSVNTLGKYQKTVCRIQKTRTQTSIAFQGTIGSRKSAQLKWQVGDYLLILVLWLYPGGITC